MAMRGCAEEALFAGQVPSLGLVSPDVVETQRGTLAAELRMDRPEELRGGLEPELPKKNWDIFASFRPKATAG